MSTVNRNRVVEIILHASGHLDEALGKYLACTYGEEKFPGVSTAKVRLVDRDPIGGDERFDREGLLPIGCGRGRFDDKDKNGRRKPGECSATLVAKFLGIDNDPALKPLLAETLKADSQSGVRMTTLPELIKMGNMVLGDTGHQFVMHQAAGVIRAIVKQIGNGYAPVAGEMGALEIFESFVSKGAFTNSKVITFIRKQLHIGAEQRGSVTELDFVVRAMQRSGECDEDDVRGFAHFMLDKLYRAQERISSIADEIHPDAKTHVGKGSTEFKFIALVGGRDRALRGIIVHSDDPFAHRACAYHRYDVRVVRQGNGQMQILADPHAGISLAQAVGMFRWLDAPTNQKPTDWEALTADGEYAPVSHWFYFKRANQVFNGSQTHRDVTPTEICSQAVIEVLSCAFHPRLIGWWKAQRGIGRPVERTPRREEPRPARKPAPVVEGYSADVEPPPLSVAVQDLGCLMDEELRRKEGR